MKKDKKCIFHIPNYINIEKKSASNIRPLRMIEAFKDNGYDVDIVMGYAKERKKQIKRIKKNIKTGIKYDFLYSESSTMPTLLTEKNHLPLYPFLDFSFINFCKKNRIKIGLFYRDIHWKFKKYKKSVSPIKRIITTIFYKYDLWMYRNLLDYLYLPSNEMKKYLPKANIITKKYIIEELPPGCEKIKNDNFSDTNKSLNIFYVGGIDEDVYNFEELIKVISQEKKVKFTICCREKDWQKVEKKYKQYMTGNIEIIHVGSKELSKYYKKADVCSLIFKNNEYMNMAMPVKLFEYLSHNKPIIATNNTISGTFVEKNKIGWTIDYDIKTIRDHINYLKNNKEEIKKIKHNQLKIINKNTWYARANKVIDNLYKKRED